MQYRGRMVAYANEEIPTLPDEAVPVSIQIEKHIFGIYEYIKYIYIYEYYIYIYIYIYIYYIYILIYIYIYTY